MTVHVAAWRDQAEADISRDIGRYLRLCGETGVQRTNSGRVHGVQLAESGTSDWTGFLRRGPNRGRFCAIEVKRPGWKPRNRRDRERYERQLAYLEDVRQAGGIGVRAESVADVEAALR